MAGNQSNLFACCRSFHTCAALFRLLAGKLKLLRPALGRVFMVSPTTPIFILRYTKGSQSDVLSSGSLFPPWILEGVTLNPKTPKP